MLAVTLSTGFHTEREYILITMEPWIQTLSNVFGPQAGYPRQP